MSATNNRGRAGGCCSAFTAAFQDSALAQIGCNMELGLGHSFELQDQVKDGFLVPRVSLIDMGCN